MASANPTNLNNVMHAMSRIEAHMRQLAQDQQAQLTLMADMAEQLRVMRAAPPSMVMAVPAATGPVMVVSVRTRPCRKAHALIRGKQTHTHTHTHTNTHTHTHTHARAHTHA
jgi:hypothetical protein